MNGAAISQMCPAEVRPSAGSSSLASRQKRNDRSRHSHPAWRYCLRGGSSSPRLVARRASIRILPVRLKVKARRRAGPNLNLDWKQASCLVFKSAQTRTLACVPPQGTREETIMRWPSTEFTLSAAMAISSGQLIWIVPTTKRPSNPQSSSLVITG
jgi:hypothetical protein